MLSFRAALLKALHKYGVVALVVAVVVGLAWWSLDHWLGDWVVNYFNSHTLQWIDANPIAAFIIAGVLFVAFCAFIATRDEWIRKLAEFTREPEIPALEIAWKPGENTYVHRYTLPPDQTIITHYRVCIINTSKQTRVIDIRVLLESLDPHELPCVPCCLRLMNNILPGDTPIERFSLNPGDKQFIDLMAQAPNDPNIWIWHTVVPRITEKVPAQPYTLVISATAANTNPISRKFSLVKNGPLWDLRAMDA